MEVLILTGACAVGKTTIASAWAKAKEGAIVECDYFTEWIFKSDFPHWTQEEEQLTAKMAAVTAIEYLRYGMPVAIENVWSPLGLRLLKEQLMAEPTLTGLKQVWLYCNLSENQRRDQLRVPENRMLERVAVVNEELQAYDWPADLHRVDTSTLSVAETVALIDSLT